MSFAHSRNMNNRIENRKNDRLKVKGINCYFKINLNNGFVELTGKVIDASQHGIRIRMAYKPSVLDQIQIKSNYAFGSSSKDDVILVVKWCRILGVDYDQEFEVGCEVQDQDINICKHLEIFN